MLGDGKNLEAVLTRQITSKGQVTIPQALRDDLGLSPGDRVDFMKSPEGDILVRKSLPREKFFGLMDDYSNPKKSVALEEIDAAVLETAKKEF